MAKVIFLMADYGQDPTETAVPFHCFTQAGFQIHFATETGKTPICDSRMLTGWTQKFLGAPAQVITAYNKMMESESIKKPLSWSSPGFSLDDYNLVFLPGGHDSAARQVFDNDTVHQALLSYFPTCTKGFSRGVAAICHGVLCLSESVKKDGTSLLADRTTTTLPGAFEQGVYWGTRLFLGDYYKTYGAASDSTETMVVKRLKDPEKQFKKSLGTAPFVVEDPDVNYLSARFPPDAQLLAEKAIEMVNIGLKT